MPLTNSILGVFAPSEHQVNAPYFGHYRPLEYVHSPFSDADTLFASLLAIDAIQDGPYGRWENANVPNTKAFARCLVSFRSEERRVGKEGRSRWSPDH